MYFDCNVENYDQTAQTISIYCVKYPGFLAQRTTHIAIKQLKIVSKHLNTLQIVPLHAASHQNSQLCLRTHNTTRSYFSMQYIENQIGSSTSFHVHCLASCHMGHQPIHCTPILHSPTSLSLCQTIIHQPVLQLVDQNYWTT